MIPWQYPFDPLPKQREAIVSDADEVLYGGSLGSGKSEMLLAACITVCTMIPNAKALMLRRTYDELSELVDRLKTTLPPEVAVYNKQEHAYKFANGAQLILGYLKNEDDATRYQGKQYVLICFDELTHFDKKSYVLLLSRLRGTGQIRDDMKRFGFNFRALSASNPGGKGHGWVKERFIDPAPARATFTQEDGARCIFIPAKFTDNPYLDHEDYLRKLGPMDPELKRAMLDGDWSITSGVRFSAWRERLHVLKPEDLPIPTLTGQKVIAIDYGFSAPYAAVWLCKLHDGLVVQYREDYAVELTATQQAQRILDMSREEEERTGEKIPIVMDPAMWRRNDATVHKTLDKDAPPLGSPAHDYQTVMDRRPQKAVNPRKHGWSVLDKKLAAQDDGFARFMVYETCRDTIRTVPALPRSKTDPEDVDTHAEDHLADALRYGLMFLEGHMRGSQATESIPTHSTISSVLKSKNF